MGIIISIVKFDSMAQSYELLMRIEGIKHNKKAKKWKILSLECSENL